MGTWLKDKITNSHIDWRFAFDERLPLIKYHRHSRRSSDKWTEEEEVMSSQASQLVPSFHGQLSAMINDGCTLMQVPINSCLEKQLQLFFFFFLLLSSVTAFLPLFPYVWPLKTSSSASQVKWSGRESSTSFRCFVNPAHWWRRRRMRMTRGS